MNVASSLVGKILSQCSEIFELNFPYLEDRNVEGSLGIVCKFFPYVDAKVENTQMT